MRGADLACHLLNEIRATDLDEPVPLAAIMSALMSCVLATINGCADDDVRARIAITAMQAIVENVDVPRSAMIEAAKDIALSDVEGSA